MLQIRSFRSEDHPYRYKKTYEKVHNISPLLRCFRCDALLECARPGGFRIANWDPPQCPRALDWRVCFSRQFALTSLSLRSLRLAHKSTSKLVLLVLVTRVCHAAFREVRSRRGETIGFRGITAFTVPAINILLRWPPQNSAGGLKTRRMRCRSRFGSAFGIILGALALFFGPLRFHKSVPDAFWAPFWDPQDPKIYAPVEARA